MNGSTYNPKGNMTSKRQRPNRTAQMMHLNIESNPSSSSKVQVLEGKKKRSSQHLHDFLETNKRKLITGFIIIAFLYQTNVTFSDVKLAKVYEESAMIRNNYADITDLDDLEKRSKRIENYCYPGMEKSCQCENPMIGKGRQGQKHWLKTSHENSDSVISVKDSADVIFYGDSITEGWKETSYGFYNGRKAGNKAIFDSLFTIGGGGKYEGIPMGISGDRSPDLLWRIQNGEMPQSLNPSVFWLLIGTNDLGWAYCSPETTLVGILRVVEELKAKKPGSHIVINGLLPRSFDTKHGYVMKKKRPGIKHSSKNPPSLWKDIQAINKQLEEYANLHDNVDYFDASDVFIKDMTVDEKDLQIDGNLMYDFLHPSNIGYKLFGDRIVEKLDSILKQQ